MKKLEMATTLSLLMLIGCGERAELDRRMEQLCKVDGGLKVYESVVLPKEAYDQNNNILQVMPKMASPYDTLITDEYATSFHLTVIKPGDPVGGEGLLQRRESKVLRVADGKILAESVQYVRAGGDGLHLGHHTTTVCPVLDGGLLAKVFTRGSK